MTSDRMIYIHTYVADAKDYPQEKICPKFKIQLIIVGGYRISRLKFNKQRQGNWPVAITNTVLPFITFIRQKHMLIASYSFLICLYHLWFYYTSLRHFYMCIVNILNTDLYLTSTCIHIRNKWKLICLPRSYIPYLHLSGPLREV